MYLPSLDKRWQHSATTKVLLFVTLSLILLLVLLVLVKRKKLHKTINYSLQAANTTDVWKLSNNLMEQKEKIHQIWNTIKVILSTISSYLQSSIKHNIIY